MIELRYDNVEGDGGSLLEWRRLPPIMRFPSILKSHDFSLFLYGFQNDEQVSATIKKSFPKSNVLTVS